MRVFAALVLIFLTVPWAAQAKDLEIALAHERVDITTGFNGTEVALFGTIRNEGADLIVTLKGPEHTMVVRRKDRVIGAWMNHESVEFRRVPSYYDYAATLAGDALTDLPLAKDEQIGVDNLGFYPEDADEDPAVMGTFRDALIRRMQEKGFFPLKAGGLSFIAPGFFRAVFELPPGVPTGVYTIQAIMVKDGAILAREARTFQVGQVGFNAKVYSFAHDSSFFYGVFGVLFALFSGWAAFTFLRRD